MRDNGELDRRTYLKSAGVGSLLTVAGMAGCIGNITGSNSSNKSIRIGVGAPYRPFEYFTVDGDLVGFDIAIGRAIFNKQLGIDINYTDISFSGLIQSLKNGKIRSIMAAMTITPERKEEVDFSDPYYTTHQVVVVPKKSNITSKTDLKGIDVGVAEGTTGAMAARDLKKQFNGNLRIRTFPRSPPMFKAMSNSQINAIIIDQTVGLFYMHKFPQFKILKGEKYKYMALTTEHYGAAFRKDDPLVDKFNKKLAVIRKNGTYDEIYKEFIKTQMEDEINISYES